MSPLVIPNVMAVMTKSMAGVQISSVNALMEVLVGVVVLLVLGVYLTRRSNDDI